MVTDVYENAHNGVVISTKRFVEGLKERNHQVTVVCAGTSGNGIVGLKKYSPPFLRNFLDNFEYTIAVPDKNLIKKTFNEMDIVHVHLPLWLGILSVKIANDLGIPVVTTFHMQAENLLYNLNINSNYFVRLVYQFLIKNVYNRSDHVIFPSQFAKDELIKYGLTTEGTIISNGVTDMYHPQNISRPLRYKNKFIILMVARLTHEKRQDTLIRAVSKSRYKDQIQPILIGKGIDKEKLLKLGEALPNPPEFFYLEPHELVYYYNLADLYVHTSEIEVESMTTLEASACGLPVLVSDSDRSAAKQFALDQRFLFRNNDEDDLAQKIDYWFENQEELDDTRKTFHFNSRKYHVKYSLDKLEEVYAKVCGQSQNP
jgi:1,2-diacylglycerol 3-alpha-glucosyltransferase